MIVTNHQVPTKVAKGKQKQWHLEDGKDLFAQQITKITRRWTIKQIVFVHPITHEKHTNSNRSSHRHQKTIKRHCKSNHYIKGIVLSNRKFRMLILSIQLYLHSLYRLLLLSLSLFLLMLISCPQLTRPQYVQNYRNRTRYNHHTDHLVNQTVLSKRIDRLNEVQNQIHHWCINALSHNVLKN